MVSAGGPSPAWLSSSPDPRQPDRRRLRRHALSASLLGDELEARREQLRATLPIRRRRRTRRRRRARRAPHDQHGTDGATYDIDGGQQLM
jgi:hypothetical protein